MPRTLIVRSVARADILRQVRYLVEQHAPAAAGRFPEAANDAFTQLLDMPGLGAPQKFAHPKLGQMRAWPVPGFDAIRVYYQEIPQGIRVVRVLHSRRDLRRIFSRKAP